MRSLRFRFWKEGKKQGILELKQNNILDMGWEWDSVDQFTGLLDKNGKEIFEGDILLCDDEGEYFPQEYSEEKDEYFPVGKYAVEWKGEIGYPAFDLKDSPCDEHHSICHCMETGSVEIIGNIYENPELLN